MDRITQESRIPSEDQIDRALGEAAAAGLLGDLSVGMDGGVMADDNSQPPHRLVELIESFPKQPNRPSTDHSIIIGIAGGSGSGKTYLARNLRDLLTTRYGLSTSLLSMDDYYLDRSAVPEEDRAGINYDVPAAIDTGLLAANLRDLASGKMVDTPRYHFGTHTRESEKRSVLPTRIIIVEGILLFAVEDLLNLFHLRVYRSCDRTSRKFRRIKRDKFERMREPESVIAQWKATVIPAHDRYVAPSAQYADVIIGQASSSAVVPEATVGAMVAHLVSVNKNPNHAQQSELNWDDNDNQRIQTKSLHTPDRP